MGAPGLPERHLAWESLEVTAVGGRLGRALWMAKGIKTD